MAAIHSKVNERNLVTGDVNEVHLVLNFPFSLAIQAFLAITIALLVDKLKHRHFTQALKSPKE